MEKFSYNITDRGLTWWSLRDALDSGNGIWGGSCFIKRENDQYVMTGPMGRHSINADEKHTSNDRLWTHWNGFKSNNGVQS